MRVSQSQIFMRGYASPFTRPSSPDPDLNSPSSPNNDQTAEQLLISLRILAFAESGVGSELEAL